MPSRSSSPAVFGGGSIHAPRALFFIVLLAGVFLRFHALDRQSLWKNELSTMEIVAAPGDAFMGRIAAFEINPPLYFLQLRLWASVGLRSLVKLRANSAFWGSLALWLAYLAGKRHGGEPLGLLTLAWLALSPYHLAHSQDLRPYAMAVTLGLAAYLALERRSWIGLGALWIALLCTQYGGIFVIAAQALYASLRAPSHAERKTVALTMAAAVGGFLLWLPTFVRQIRISHSSFAAAPAFSVANLAKSFLPLSGLIFNMGSSVFYLPARVWVLVLSGFLTAAAFSLGLKRGPRAAMAWVGAGLLLPWLFSYANPALFVWYAYPILLLPAFALLTADGLLAWRPRLLSLFLILTCLGSEVWGDWTYFNGWQKANIKSVAQYVHHVRQKTSLVVRPKNVGDLFNFYDQGTTATLDAELFDTPAKRAALKGHAVILLAYDIPADPITDALLQERPPTSARYFPGTAHRGITVYELK